MSQCSAYLNFNGNCREALEFYAKAAGGEIIAMQTFGEAPGDFPVPDDFKKQIIHGRIKFGNTLLMGSDSPPERHSKPAGFGISLAVDTPEEAERAFANLSDGATIDMPMGETFFANRFGMLKDRYGVMWMVICEKPMP
jgi:PhnB protein